MRTAGFLVLCLMAAAPAYAQAPWEASQPGVPGVPGVPGAPGAPSPYGYGADWRLRQMEAQRRSHDRESERYREGERYRAGERRGERVALHAPQGSVGVRTAHSTGTSALASKAPAARTREAATPARVASPASSKASKGSK